MSARSRLPAARRPVRSAVGRAALGLALLPALAGCTGGTTPLSAAAAAGDQPLLERLLVAGADPDELDGAGRSPLIRAVRAGHFRLVGILVARGADPDLRGRARGWTPLLHAVHAKETDAVRALLNAGADPNVASTAGRTPLMMAAGYGFARITELLLERGADPRARSRSGGVALGDAVVGVFELDYVTIGSCQTDTVRALVKAAPDLRLADDSWALRLARLKRCHEIVEMAGG